ncbi:MAG: 2-oxoacid:acceptor oxidoreductase subunit alpha [Microgenomates group bacterium]
MNNWKIAGLAGGGIAVTGTLYAKLAMRHGLHVFSYGEYPSLIRGGHNSLQVTTDSSQVTTQQKLLDVLVALNADGITLHLDELSQNSIILVDKTQVKLDWDKLAVPGTVIDLPMYPISLELTGSGLAANMVALGASCYLMGLDISLLHNLIKETFIKKGEEVVQKDQLATEKGYEYAKAHHLTAHKAIIPIKQDQIYLSGNEAVGLGALAGGIQFYAGYPMTPVTSLLEFLADAQKSYPIVVKHSEDEIGAINQAIGASYAGARSMIASSGGGFALMVEGLSLAAITETPLVIMVGQRPGPATGLPTWTAQADLQFVLHAGHGEFGKIVLAPGDIEECFTMTRLAFILAEQWHTQVYLLTDKYLIESSMSVPQFETKYPTKRYNLATDLPSDDSYKRYAMSDSGYSPRSIPGSPHGLSLTNSYEHDEYGYATEDSVMAKAQIDKRLRKLDNIASYLPKPILYGPKEADITFVSWGSTKLVMLHTLNLLNQARPNTANFIQLGCLAPFDAETFTSLAKSSKRLIMVEGNATGQAESLIRQHTGIEFKERLSRYDGRPFYAQDIVTYVQGGVK